MQGRFQTEWARLGLQAHFAKEVFYKILLTSHFPQFSKVIISDVDVVFLGDISEGFLALDSKEDFYIAGVKANNPNAIYPLTGWKEGYRHFSKDAFEAVKNGIGGGYLIANLDAWRRDNIEAKLVDYLTKNARSLVLAEQDVLNIICHPNIATLSPAHIVCNWHWEAYGKEWENLTPEVYSKDELDNARDNPVQLHFVGDKKPWSVPSVPKSEIWYQYMLKTTFAREFLDNLESLILIRNQKKPLLKRVINKIRRSCKLIKR